MNNGPQNPVELARARRARYQIYMQATAAFFGAMAYGVLMGVLAFGMAYFYMSPAGTLTGIMLHGYGTTLLMAVIPTALAPYSTAILLLLPGSVLLGSVIYAVRTNTLGLDNFGLHSVVSMMNTLSYAAPFLMFALGLGKGYAVIEAFKMACWAGFGAGLYLGSFPGQLINAVVTLIPSSKIYAKNMFARIGTLIENSPRAMAVEQLPDTVDNLNPEVREREPFVPGFNARVGEQVQVAVPHDVIPQPAIANNDHNPGRVPI